MTCLNRPSPLGSHEEGVTATRTSATLPPWSHSVTRKGRSMTEPGSLSGTPGHRALSEVSSRLVRVPASVGLFKDNTESRSHDARE